MHWVSTSCNEYPCKYNAFILSEFKVLFSWPTERKNCLIFEDSSLVPFFPFSFYPPHQTPSVLSSDQYICAGRLWTASFSKNRSYIKILCFHENLYETFMKPSDLGIINNVSHQFPENYFGLEMQAALLNFICTFAGNNMFLCPRIYKTDTTHQVQI